MCPRWTRTALDAVLITALGSNLDALTSVPDPLAKETGEDETAAVDHVEWASEELQVHRQRWTEEPGLLRPSIIYEPAGCGIPRVVRYSCCPAPVILTKVT